MANTTSVNVGMEQFDLIGTDKTPPESCAFPWTKPKHFERSICEADDP